MNPFGVGSAHGKVIWFGEHAVVYHFDAIALPIIPLKVTLKMSPSLKTELHSDFYQGPLEENSFLKGFFMLHEALKKQLPIQEVKIELSSDLPVGAGLGASAAIASAWVMAAYDLTDQPLDAKTHFDLIQISEQFFHENPSGIDAMMTLSYDPIRYKKDQTPVPINVDLDGFLAIVYSNQKGLTVNAIQTIQTLMKQKSYQKMMSDLGHNTELALQFIAKKDIRSLGKLMAKSHELLTTFNVSHKALDFLVSHAYLFNALGAKLSGGGLGGVMIALFESIENAHKFISSVKDQGYTIAFTLPLKKEGL
jgi:mevalonate kinase